MTNPNEHDIAAAREVENFCDICCARKVAPPEYPNDSVCQCKGLQPYSMSNYPGEYRLTESHPNNGGQQWYKRSEVDSKFDELAKHHEADRVELEQLRKDREEAAKSFAVPIEELTPGSNGAKLLIAGRLLKQERDSLLSRLAEMEKALREVVKESDEIASAIEESLGEKSVNNRTEKLRALLSKSPSSALSRLELAERKARALDCDKLKEMPR